MATIIELKRLAAKLNADLNEGEDSTFISLSMPLTKFQEKYNMQHNFIHTSCEDSLQNNIDAGSKGFKRALREKNEYINKTVKELPEVNYVIEDLKKLKYKSKSRGLGKGFRRKLQFWNYRKVLTRIQNRAEVVGVQCQSVSPSYITTDMSYLW